MFFGAPNVQTKPWIQGPCAAIEKNTYTPSIQIALSLVGYMCFMFIVKVKKTRWYPYCRIKTKWHSFFQTCSTLTDQNLGFHWNWSISSIFSCQVAVELMRDRARAALRAGMALGFSQGKLRYVWLCLTKKQWNINWTWNGRIINPSGFPKYSNWYSIYVPFWPNMEHYWLGKSWFVHSLEDKQVCSKLLQLNHGRVWGVNWSIGQLTSCLVHPLYLGNASALGETND